MKSVRSLSGICSGAAARVVTRAVMSAVMRAASAAHPVTCAALTLLLVATPAAPAEALTPGEVLALAAQTAQTAPAKRAAPPESAPAAKGSAAGTTSASASTAATTGGRAATEEIAPAAGARVLSRMVVLGASASCGVNLPGSLADAMGASIAAEHEAPLDASSVLFFMLDDMTRGGLVKKAAGHQPSALIGIDFLFWYGYGDVAEDERLPLLEQGLALLDGFACPIVIGEFPDMSPAVGLMLQASQVPAPETLVALNARLKAWAAERPRVIVVPLVETIAQMRAGAGIAIGALKLPGCEQSRYLQPDKLHPTAEGLAVMACLVNEGLRTHVTGLKTTDFVSEPAAILAAYTEATKDRKPRGLF